MSEGKLHRDRDLAKASDKAGSLRRNYGHPLFVYDKIFLLIK